MKELSIEEKAKAYDEARKKIAIRFGSNVADEIFSQFEMSEDERIRKELLNAFQESEDSLYMVLTPHRRESFIAWLEKQGEQKPADSKIIDLDELVIELEETIGTSSHSRETIKDFFQRAVQKYMNCLRIANGEIGRLVDENYLLKEKQGEQKTAWSEEDEDILNTIINHFKVDIECTDEDDMVRWLKSLKDRVLPQPKQEWSEEDKNMLQSILDEYKSMPTEKRNWLKSLRPQNRWKPSDEQMKALADALSLANNCGEEMAFDLRTLYEQLKKLREE